MTAERDTLLADKDALTEKLTEQGWLLKTIRFAKNSEMQEKPARSEMQYSLFDEAETVVEKAPEAEEPELIQAPSNPARKKAAKPFSLTCLARRSSLMSPRKASFVLVAVPEMHRRSRQRKDLDHSPEGGCETFYPCPRNACRRCEGTEPDYVFMLPHSSGRFRFEHIFKPVNLAAIP
jgi:hypothetical protein